MRTAESYLAEARGYASLGRTVEREIRAANAYANAVEGFLRGKDCSRRFPQPWKRATKIFWDSLSWIPATPRAGKASE